MAQEFQCFSMSLPNHKCTPRDGGTIVKTTSNTKAVAELPEAYTNVNPAKLPNEQVLPEKSVLNGQNCLNSDSIGEHFYLKEFEWAQDANINIFTKESVKMCLGHLTMRIKKSLLLIVQPSLLYCLFFLTKPSLLQ